MISGLGISSSGVAQAIRTASQARATMDATARQIATGQRVSSVKDDGAAWTRANGLRSEKADWGARSFGLDRAEVGIRATEAAAEAITVRLETLKGLVLAARTHAAGSAARVQLQAEWTATIQSVASGGTNPAFEGFTGYAIDGLGIGFQVSAADPFFSGTRLAAYPALDDFAGWLVVAANPAQNRPVQLSTFDLANASTAALDDARTTIGTLLGQGTGGWATTWLQHAGMDLAQVDRMREQVVQNTDRLDTAIGSLTDADLGRTAAARAQAETRQQLALSTVRQAISTYGNMASGLLSNVQRTQRGVLA